MVVKLLQLLLPVCKACLLRPLAMLQRLAVLRWALLHDVVMWW